MRALLVGITVYMGLIIAGFIFGGVLSFGTGSAEELPKWNGGAYLFFCAGEGAMFAAILTWPIGILASLVTWWITFRLRKT
ncbi:hypothetical protein HED60_16360 [Planctomycetales bacterium ZRK34]|nr:hypothetical protein HED60_16360 [Planctomycetales bacterium ZRK34]